MEPIQTIVEFVSGGSSQTEYVSGATGDPITTTCVIAAIVLAVISVMLSSICFMSKTTNKGITAVISKNSYLVKLSIAIFSIAAAVLLVFGVVSNVANADSATASAATASEKITASVDEATGAVTFEDGWIKAIENQTAVFEGMNVQYAEGVSIADACTWQVKIDDNIVYDDQVSRPSTMPIEFTDATLSLGVQNLSVNTAKSLINKKVLILSFYVVTKTQEEAEEEIIEISEEFVKFITEEIPSTELFEEDKAELLEKSAAVKAASEAKLIETTDPEEIQKILDEYNAAIDNLKDEAAQKQAQIIAEKDTFTSEQENIIADIQKDINDDDWLSDGSKIQYNSSLNDILNYTLPKVNIATTRSDMEDSMDETTEGVDDIKVNYKKESKSIEDAAKQAAIADGEKQYISTGEQIGKLPETELLEEDRKDVKNKLDEAWKKYKDDVSKACSQEDLEKIKKTFEEENKKILEEAKQDAANVKEEKEAAIEKFNKNLEELVESAKNENLYGDSKTALAEDIKEISDKIEEIQGITSKKDLATIKADIEKLIDDEKKVIQDNIKKDQESKAAFKKELDDKFTEAIKVLNDLGTKMSDGQKTKYKNQIEALVAAQKKAIDAAANKEQASDGNKQVVAVINDIIKAAQAQVAEWNIVWEPETSIKIDYDGSYLLDAPVLKDERYKEEMGYIGPEYYLVSPPTGFGIAKVDGKPKITVTDVASGQYNVNVKSSYSGVTDAGCATDIIKTISVEVENKISAKAVHDKLNHTFKFYYDKESHDGENIDVYQIIKTHIGSSRDDSTFPLWTDVEMSTYLDDVTYVEFTEGFADFTEYDCDPGAGEDFQSIDGWFMFMSNLKEVKGLEHIADKITSAKQTFIDCSGLERIYYCGDCLSSLEVSYWMFMNCVSLTGGNGTLYEQEKIEGEMAKVDLAGYYDNEDVAGYFTYNGDDACKLTYNLNGGIVEGDLYTNYFQQVKQGDYFTVQGASTLPNPEWPQTENAEQKYFAGWQVVETNDSSPYFAGSKLQAQGKQMTLVATWSEDPLKGKAVYDYVDNSFTIYYDNQSHVSEHTKVFDIVYTSSSLGLPPSWYCEEETYSTTKIVIDKSFAGFTKYDSQEDLEHNGNDFTSMDYWFSQFFSVTSITGFENIKGPIKSISHTFNSLGADNGETRGEILDLSGFPSKHLEDYNYSPFTSCNFDTLIIPDGFAPNLVVQDTDPEHMAFFLNLQCNHIIFKGKAFEKITDYSYMFRDSSVMTIDFSNYQPTTGIQVTSHMFENCSYLTTIYVNELWDLSRVSPENSANMFFSCNSLTGGQGTTIESVELELHVQDDLAISAIYAIVDQGLHSDQPGYLTLKSNEKTAKAVYDQEDQSFTFYYDYYPHISDNNQVFSITYTEAKTTSIDDWTMPSWWEGEGIARTCLVDPTNIRIDESFKEFTNYDSGDPEHEGEDFSSLDLWFFGMHHVESVTGLENICGKIKTMNNTFNNCGSSVESPTGVLDLTGLPTADVENAYQFLAFSKFSSVIIPDKFMENYNQEFPEYVFNACAINSIIFKGSAFNSLLSWSNMFNSAQSEMIDFSYFQNTSYITKTDYMFSGMYNLKKVHVNENWDMSNVSSVNSQGMFEDCNELTGEKESTIANCQSSPRNAYVNQDRLLDAYMAHIDAWNPDNPETGQPGYLSLPREEFTYNYQVCIYGIREDQSSSSSSDKVNLTFGPAMGSTNECLDVDGHHEHCIHNDSWIDIIQNCQDGHADWYSDCLEHGCTKSVPLVFNKTIARKELSKNIYTSAISFYCGYIKNDYTNWNYSFVDNDPESQNYVTSRIRATLNGSTGAESSYAGSNLLDSSNCLLSCFPTILQDAIRPKYMTIKTSDSSSENIADKLWLMNVNEIFPYNENEQILPVPAIYFDYGTQYTKTNNLITGLIDPDNKVYSETKEPIMRTLRSSYRNSPIYRFICSISTGGDISSYAVNQPSCISPCFCL